MVEISPAILTEDLISLKNLLKEYQIFKSVDIDIISKPFSEKETVKLDQILDLLDNKISYGIHLMVDSPERELILLKNTNLSNLRIYIHQESDLKFLTKFDFPKEWGRGVAIKTESTLKNLDFYNQFQEVQFMTGSFGEQSNAFHEEVLDKIELLLNMGYNGKLSIDGGVNLRTASIIKDWGLDRVSVGSYFQKSDNIPLAKMKLELALNMKSEF